jgi:hypothetical protein
MKTVMTTEDKSQHSHAAHQDKAGFLEKIREQAVHEAQEFFATLAPSEVLLSEELIRVRREEAGHE